MSCLRAALVAGVLLVIGIPPARADIIAAVRERAEAGALDDARALVRRAAAAGGVTPELLEARSWIARAALGRRQLDAALREAEETYDLAAAAAGRAGLDAERHLPIALGAAIEVKAQALAAQGERGRAVELLRAELKRFGASSIAARLQKNLNLLALEGKPALALAAEPHLGPPLPTTAARRGEATLLFFWAHWCGDCKAQAPVLARLLELYGKRGLIVIAPTQPYGAVGGGEAAPLDAELRYIDETRRTRYAALGEVPVPTSKTNFLRYGASTVPTLVLVDRAGKVVLYHPGRMTEAALAPLIEAALRD